LARGDWPADPAAAFALALEAEAELLGRLKALRFRQGASWEEASSALGASQARLRGALRRDSRAIHLIRDALPVTVLFEDAELLVLSKPPDLRAHPVHRFQGGSLLSRAAHHVGPDAPVPAVVHRLDQDTSGVMLFVKRRSSAGWYAQQFAERTATKRYAAICVGRPPAARFSVEAPIGLHPGHAPARMLCAGGKSARTAVRVAAYRPGAGDRPPACLLECTPLSGRTHQIRLHVAAAGCPIVLDPFYGAGEAAERAAMGGPPPGGMTRQALHAAGLELARMDGTAARFEAPLPDDMAALACALGLDGEGAVRGEKELAEALGEGCELVWPHNTCAVRYRDDPGAAAGEGEDEEEAILFSD